MRKFRINVNGKSYEVEVEEITSYTSSQPVSSPALQAKVSEAPEVQQPASASITKTNTDHSNKSTAGKAGSLKINAPMPGTILDIKVKVGDIVKKGQVVLILEAMKMENEIMAPKDGIISSIDTSTGTSVNSGDLLFTMN